VNLYRDINIPDANILFCFPVFFSPFPHIAKHFFVTQANEICIQDFICFNCLHPCGGSRNIFQRFDGGSAIPVCPDLLRKHCPQTASPTMPRPFGAPCSPTRTPARPYSWITGSATPNIRFAYTLYTKEQNALMHKYRGVFRFMADTQDDLADAARTLDRLLRPALFLLQPMPSPA
jgi:hypothetical protein